jgi:hypothetical protein
MALAVFARARDSKKYFFAREAHRVTIRSNDKCASDAISRGFFLCRIARVMRAARINAAKNISMSFERWMKHIHRHARA